MADSPKSHPTGFAPTALPFYEQLDPGGFEQFCTELLNLHPVLLCSRGKRVAQRRIIGAQRLLSGKPQKGGDVRADADHGEVWIFQCKRVQSFGPEQVSIAMKEAEEKAPHADQYVLVTSCGLSVDAQGRIHDSPKWQWWNASRLTTEVVKLRPREDAINLVHRFFGPEAVKSFFWCSDQPLLAWDEYFARDLASEPRHFHHHIPFLQRGDTLERLRRFARDGAGHALILSGTGGQGKSRLLLELARQCSGQPQYPRVRFLNVGRQGLNSDQVRVLMNEEKELLLIVEDAHRLGTALEGVARATSEAKSTRLLIATRPGALEALTSQLYRNGYAEKLEDPIQLPRWCSEDILQLAKRVLHAQHQSQAPRLEELADRCPLLVVLGASQVNSGAWPELLTDSEGFRERVFRSFKEDFLNLHPDAKRERLDRVIRLLSFLSPTPKSASLWASMADVLDCSALDVAEDVESLQAAGLVVENREGVRLYPDLFADAVLLDAVLDRSHQASFLYRTILAKFQLIDFPSAIRNLAQADWECRTRKGVANSLFDPVWEQFLERFQESAWEEDVRSHEAWWEPEGMKKRSGSRLDLLDHWAGFAAYLPERTLELVRHVWRELQTSEIPSRGDTQELGRTRAAVTSALLPLLRSIVMWHSVHSRDALDILWSMEVEEPRGHWEGSSNAIGVIAVAAGYGWDKPPATSRAALDWLEHTLALPESIDRLRRQPWILSALLKPVFGRDVEQSLTVGRKIHIATRPISVETTRPLRQQALRMVAAFLRSPERVLSQATVPVLAEALHPPTPRFASTPTSADIQEWRPDRLDAANLIETAVKEQANAPLLLLQLRDLLRDRTHYDPDEFVRRECERIRSLIPDTFELQVLRALSSGAHDEFHVTRGDDMDVQMKSAEEKWASFCQEVAIEAASKFENAPAMCRFLQRQVLDLESARLSTRAGQLLEPVARISPQWCAALLEELLNAQETILDGHMWTVFREAASHAPDSYCRALDQTVTQGRSVQLCTLVSFLGWKHLHGGGLTEFEQHALIRATQRREGSVVHSIALVCGIHFAGEPSWAMDVLSRLHPGEEQAGTEVLAALARLIAKHGPALDREIVAVVLAHMGTFAFSSHSSDQRQLDQVANTFPKEVYQLLRRVYEHAEAHPEERRRWVLVHPQSLGALEDDAFVNREMEDLWTAAMRAEPQTFSRNFRVSLMRSLLWADPSTAPDRIRVWLERCRNGEELKLATQLVAITGSRFVFNHPDLVAALLSRSRELEVESDIKKRLWLSACGGGRSFTGRELNPEYRYILEQAEDLSHRYAHDPLLKEFYESIARSERQNLADLRRHFAHDDEMD